MPEKLIERATAQGARFDSVRLSGRSMLVTCDAGSARVLVRLCERFAIPCRVTRRGGVSALKRFARRRATLLVGFAVAAALCWLFLGRIWFVDVTLSGEVPELGDPVLLRQALADAGVRPGAAVNADLGLLSTRLQSSLDGYSYIGLRRQGVRLLLEAVPELPAPGLYDVEAARDLVSDRDGVVVRAIAQSGELCVKPGDAVRRGQLLIRGEEKATTEETRPIAALGEVIVRAWYAGEARLPLRQAKVRYTGRASTSSALRLMDARWPITEGAEFASQAVELRVLPVGGLFLPLWIEERACFETETAFEAIDPEALKVRLSALALADAGLSLAREGPAEYNLADSWVTYEIEGGALLARAVYEIHTDAAVTREVLQGG